MPHLPTARARRIALGSTVGVLLLGGIWMAGVLSGQTPDTQSSTPVFRGRVDVVRVDVSVTAGREVVADLSARDFEVREDGVLQSVSTAQFVRMDGQRRSDTDESLPIRSTTHAALEAARDDVRVFAIFLDDYHVERNQQTVLRARTALREFVRRFGPNDLVAVMDPLTPLSALRFTRAPDELARRMDAFDGRLYQLFPVRSVMEEAQNMRPNVWEIRGAVTFSALEALATYLGGLREGRKSVLFVSQGPSMGDMGLGNENRLRAAIEAANRGNVTVHVFDPRTLGAVQAGGADSLARLATETGGRVIANMNAPADGLAQTIADASAYYLVGYTPSRTVDDGKFHRIDVRVRRRGVEVRARKGYWAPAATDRLTTTPAPMEPGLRGALDTLARPMTGQAVEIWLGLSPGADGRTRLTVTWDRAVGQDGPAPVLVEVEPLSPGRPARNEGAPLGEDARSITATGQGRFDLAPGSQTTLRLTARAADGTVLDQWQRAVAAPRWSDAAIMLSTPRVLRARTVYEQRALEVAVDPHPAASRRFRRSDRVLLEVDLHVLEGMPVLSGNLLNARGQTLMALQPALHEGRRVRLALPLSSLAPGAYVVRVRAAAGAATSEQAVAFTLE